MHPQQPLKKQTPRRPTCFSSPSEARTPQGGGLGGTLKTSVLQPISQLQTAVNNCKEQQS